MSIIEYFQLLGPLGRWSEAKRVREKGHKVVDLEETDYREDAKEIYIFDEKIYAIEDNMVSDMTPTEEVNEKMREIDKETDEMLKVSQEALDMEIDT